jgi:thiamine transporter ThiT
MESTDILVWIAEILIIVIFGFALRRYVSRKNITAKQITFVGVMSAMGTVLAIVSFIPIAPNIHIDLSHIGTFIVAIALGPFYGMITGALIGIYPMTVFGNVLVPPGKALTGLVVGALAMKLRLAMNDTEEKRRIPRIVPTVFVGWIPEAVFVLVTLGIIGIPYLLPMPVVEGILVKGTAEIILLGIVCEFLFASKALKHSLQSLREN